MFRIAGILSVAMFLLAGSSFAADTTSMTSSKAEIVDCATITPAVEVALIDYGFDPPTVKISPGSVVKWTNKGDVSHIVKSGSPEATDAGLLFDTGFITVRNSRCIRFAAPGTYTYFCRIHSKVMREGAIIVE